MERRSQRDRTRRRQADGGRRKTRSAVLLAAAALLLASSLTWGLATALAVTTSSPSPSAGKVILKLGWTEEPDNLNPFIGYQNETYEI